MGDPIEVRKDGCQASGLHMQDHDEPRTISTWKTSRMFFLYPITSASNMTYFNAPQIVHNHCADKQEINRALCDEVHVVMDGDGMDLELDDLQHAWMVEDTHEGVARALNGCSNHTPIVAKITPIVIDVTPTIDAHANHSHIAAATCRLFGPRIKNAQDEPAVSVKLAN